MQFKDFQRLEITSKLRQYFCFFIIIIYFSLKTKCIWMLKHSLVNNPNNKMPIFLTTNTKQLCVWVGMKV